MLAPELIKQYRFFRKRGGGWVGHDAEQALRNARAYLVLRDAIDEGRAEVCWECDSSPDISWMDAQQMKDLESEHAFLLQVLLKVEGEVVSALGGVHVGPRCAGDSYCRVVEAELADAHLDALQHALRGCEEMIGCD